MSTQLSICVLGAGYTGLITATCLAEMGHRVICTHKNEAWVKTILEGGIPIQEEHLPELLARNHGRTLEFKLSLGSSVEGADAIITAIGPPDGDVGRNNQAFVEAIIAQSASFMKGYAAIIDKSTVPLHTNNWLSALLRRHSVESSYFDLISNPESLRAGTAIIDFLHPNQIVAASSSERASQVFRSIYEPLTKGSYYEQPGALQGPRSVTHRPGLDLTNYDQRTRMFTLAHLWDVDD